MTVVRPSEELAYVATCQGGTGGPCCDPDCDKCWPDRPLPEGHDPDLDEKGLCRICGKFEPE